jgi:hypothetical protein
MPAHSPTATVQSRPKHRRNHHRNRMPHIPLSHTNHQNRAIGTACCVAPPAHSYHAAAAAAATDEPPPLLLRLELLQVGDHVGVYVLRWGKPRAHHVTVALGLAPVTIRLDGLRKASQPAPP